MANGVIRITVKTNGAVSTDMSGFKKCSDKTKEILSNLELEADSITIKDRPEEVQNVATNRVRVSS